jgi:5-methylcytosine-specific restriction endonuclease McrA
MRLCVETGCGNTFQPDPNRRRNDRCPVHQAHWDKRDNHRRNAHPRQQVYRDPRWARTRKTVLSRDEWTCHACGVTGDIVDHTDSISVIMARGDSPFDPDLCQVLCAHCSGVKDGARA